MENADFVHGVQSGDGWSKGWNPTVSVLPAVGTILNPDMESCMIAQRKLFVQNFLANTLQSL